MNRKPVKRLFLSPITGIIGTILCAAILFPALPSGADVFNTWETPKKSVLRELSDKNVRYKEFHPKKDPKYENKIMNYILAINENLKDDMIIIRTRTTPVRDFLFLKNKLYSIMELYGIVKKDKLDGVLAELTSAYGKPQVRNEKNLTIYSFSGSATKVFLHSSLISQEYDCRIYYYSANLFRKLVTE